MGKGKQKRVVGTTDYKDGDELAGSTLEEYFATHKVNGLVSHHLLNLPTAKNNVMAAEEAEIGQAQGREVKSEQANYEDDYELDETTTVEVAGMSLCDYLHVKDDESADAKDAMVVADSQHGTTSQVALGAAKAVCDINGMSLDHYLGTDQPVDANGHASVSPKAKRQGIKSKQPSAVEGCGARNESSVSASVTPFQRRQKRKDRVQRKQQRSSGTKSLVARAKAVAEAGKDREKRRLSCNASHLNVQATTLAHPSPLPKLALSPSIHNLSHKNHEVESDKLPPL